MRRVTFSRNYTLSLSRTCQCFCKYCAFATHRAHVHDPEEVERRLEEAKHQQQAFHQYVQTVAGSGGASSAADELAKLADLKDRGVISDEEFQQMKATTMGKASA